MTGNAYAALTRSRHLPTEAGFEHAAQGQNQRFALCRNPTMGSNVRFIHDTLDTLAGIGSFRSGPVLRDLVAHSSGEALEEVISHLLATSVDQYNRPTPSAAEFIAARPVTPAHRTGQSNRGVSATGRAEAYTDRCVSMIGHYLHQLPVSYRPQRSHAAEAVIETGGGSDELRDRVASAMSPAQRVRYVLARGYTEQRCVDVLAGPAATALGPDDHQAYRLFSVARPHETGMFACALRAPKRGGKRETAGKLRIASTWTSLRVWRTAPHVNSRLTAILAEVAAHPPTKRGGAQQRSIIAAFAAGLDDPGLPDSVRRHLDNVLDAYAADAPRDTTPVVLPDAAAVFQAVNTADATDATFGCLAPRIMQTAVTNSYDTEQLIAAALGDDVTLWRFALDAAHDNTLNLTDVCELAAAVSA